ncbi:MAG: GldG family protein [Bacteroidales bacterium]|jgi:gliding-associated putative ABC transporter substrate-binding component GldG
MKSAKISYTIILVVLIIILINVLSENYSFRLDMTDNKEYTLSKATRDILKNLDKPVTVTVYFSKNLPANIGQITGDLKDMLIEYGSRSGGMVVYKFVNPNENDELEREAVQNGMRPIIINVREKDQEKQQKVYLGAVVSMGSEKEKIPFFEPGSEMEYSLSAAIKKLAVVDKPSIAIIQGHGEPSLNEIVQVYTELKVLYNVETLQLSDTAAIPKKYKTIAIIRPRDTIPASQLLKLDKYLEEGGNILLAMSRVEGNFTTLTGRSFSIGIESWLQKKGIAINDNFIVDASCGYVTIQQQQGTYLFSSKIRFPYIPVIHNFADHPITRGLESVTLQFASTIVFSGDSSIRFTPIAFSSDKSGSLKAPLSFDIQKKWDQSEFPLSSQVVAGILEGKLSGTRDSRIVLVSNGDFCVAASNGRNHPPADNISLLVNSIDWLSDDTGLIELRTKEITSRPIKQLDDNTKMFLKWFNFLAPIILILIYGLIRIRVNKTRRIKRMEVSNE